MRSGRGRGSGRGSDGSDGWISSWVGRLTKGDLRLKTLRTQSTDGVGVVKRKRDGLVRSDVNPAMRGNFRLHDIRRIAF